MEREEVIRALGRFSGNRTRTAQALGIGVRTLGLKLKKWKEQNLVAQSV
ncbi:MAG: helix-turn-helix domain-containing protein [Phycisphaeraceae bacterium]